MGQSGVKEKKLKKNQIGIKVEGKDFEKEMTKAWITPECSATHILINLEPDLTAANLYNAFADDSARVIGGNMSKPQAMLISQAIALEKLFASLATKALNQTHMPNYESFMRLALKAQNQSRMTLETLSNIKNPPVVYAKQANITSGPQQINNGVSIPPATENQNQQNELLTVNHGETLDGGATGETIGSNQAMEALETQHRATNNQG